MHTGGHKRINHTAINASYVPSIYLCAAPRADEAVEEHAAANVQEILLATNNGKLGGHSVPNELTNSQKGVLQQSFSLRMHQPFL